MGYFVVFNPRGERVRVLYDSKHAAGVALGVTQKETLALLGEATSLSCDKDKFLHFESRWARPATPKTMRIHFSVHRTIILADQAILCATFFLNDPRCLTRIAERLHDAWSRLLLGSFEHLPDDLLAVFFSFVLCALHFLPFSPWTRPLNTSMVLL